MAKTQIASLMPTPPEPAASRRADPQATESANDPGWLFAKSPPNRSPLRRRRTTSKLGRSPFSRVGDLARNGGARWPTIKEESSEEEDGEEVGSYRKNKSPRVRISDPASLHHRASPEPTPFSEMHEDLDVEMFEDPLKLDGTEMNAGRRLSKLGFAPDTRRTVVGTAGSTWNARERLWQISFKGMARSEKDMGTILAVGGIMPVIEKDEEGHPKVYEVLQVITRRRRDGGRLKWVFRHFSLDQKSQELRVFRLKLNRLAMQNELSRTGMLKMKDGLPDDADVQVVAKHVPMRVIITTIYKIHAMWRHVVSKRGWPGGGEPPPKQDHLDPARVKAAVSIQSFMRVLLAKRSFKGLRELRNSQCSNAILVKDVTWLRELITRRGATVRYTYPDMPGRTHLHVAAATNSDEAVEALIQLGANLHAADAKGDTPLHLACVKRYAGPALRLALAGADIDCENLAGHTPSSRPHFFLIALLEGHRLSLSGPPRASDPHRLKRLPLLRAATARDHSLPPLSSPRPPPTFPSPSARSEQRKQSEAETGLASTTGSNALLGSWRVFNFTPTKPGISAEAIQTRPAPQMHVTMRKIQRTLEMDDIVHRHRQSLSKFTPRGKDVLRPLGGCKNVRL